MSMNDFLLAGKITAKVREESKKWIVAGAKYVDIADKIEGRIKELGAKPSFPVNISVNDKAAHDTARPNDDRELRVGDVVKIDLGAQVNGWPGDTAYTVEIGTDKFSDLIKSTSDALNKAISIVNEGVELRMIGSAIQGVIEGAGFNPIRNLGGHPLSQNKLHGEFFIPNFDNHSTFKLRRGGLAIEPFATTGDGWVDNSSEMLIYNLERPKPVRNVIARKILKFIIKEYGTLPFAERWISREFKHYEFGLRTLINEGMLHGYNILKERSGGVVAQTEHSLLINDKVIVTTRV